jgi:hypothetical protein
MKAIDGFSSKWWSMYYCPSQLLLENKKKSMPLACENNFLNLICGIDLRFGQEF